MVDGTVLDYGIPDFSHLSASSEEHQRQMATLLAGKIAAHEPRLRDVRVVVKVSPHNPRAMVGIVAASWLVGSVYEPVTFPLSITRSMNASGELADIRVA